jgi:hypothetical protein
MQLSPWVDVRKKIVVVGGKKINNCITQLFVNLKIPKRVRYEISRFYIVIILFTIQYFSEIEKDSTYEVKVHFQYDFLRRNLRITHS